MLKASRLRSTHLAAALLLAGFFVGAVAVQPTQTQRAKRPKWPNLSGTWRLNESLSADWSNAMSNEVGSELIMTPVSFDAASLYVMPIKGAETSARVRELLDATRKLEIFQQRRELTLNATGAKFVVLARTFPTDDAAALRGFGPGSKGSSQAQWADNRFIIETTVGTRPTVDGDLRSVRWPALPIRKNSERPAVYPYIRSAYLRQSTGVWLTNG